jgi:hypothetical protein
MSAIENLPTNINFLSQNGFRFSIKRLPNVNYFCQSATIPAVSLGVVETPTPLAFIPRPGDRITYDPLELTFKVDENLANYFEIQQWIEGLGHPESLEQTTALSRSIREGQSTYRPVGSIPTFVSDAVLSILTSNKNVNKNIFFYDLFPIGLSSLNFVSTNTTIEYLEATATFRYRRYVLET